MALVHRKGSGWRRIGQVAIGTGLVVTVAAVAALGVYKFTGKNIPQDVMQRVTSLYQQPGSNIPLTPESPLESALNDIRARESKVADALQNADWVSNGVTPKEADFIKWIAEDTKRGYNSSGSITRPDGSVTTVVVRDADGPGKRDEALTKTLQYLPEVEKLLGIQYNKSFLWIQFLAPEAKESTISFWSIGLVEEIAGGERRSMTAQETSDLEHRLVDVVYEFSESQDPKANQNLRIYPTSWVAAGLPELVSRYLKGGDALVEQGRQEVEAAFKSAGIKSMGNNPWDFGVRNPTYSDGSFLLLVEYKNMVGYPAFWDAMREVYEFKVERGILQPIGPIHQIDLKELGKLMAKYVPPERVGDYLEWVRKEKVDDFLAKDMNLRLFWPLYQLRVLGEDGHFPRDQ